MAGGSNKRLRFSSTIDGNQLFDKDKGWAFTDKMIAPAKGQIDDFSLLRLVTHDDNQVDAFKQEPLAVALSTDAGWKSVVNSCHDNHVQLLIGFAHAETFITPRATAFLKWLYADKGPTSPTVAQWAQKLVTYCKRFPGMSGISFDIENIGLGSMPLPKDPAARRTELDRRGQRWSQFYGGVADAFAKKGWIVAAFLKPKVADDKGTLTLTDDTVRVHPYEMANGHDNLILRPMAYEADATEAWHKAICDYAVGTVAADGTLSGGKCQPENFQLTVKVGSSRNPGQVVTDDAGHVVPELGIISPATDVPPRCKTIFRPHLVGVCLFPGAGTASWKDINQALNNNVAGSMKDWPKQVPITKDPTTASGGEFEKV